MAFTPLQENFINEYLIDYNATRAAERAGYRGNDNVLAVTGHDLLRNPKISETIRTRISERALTADEVLMRLGEQARGSMADFVRFTDNGDPVFDLQTASMMGKLGLVKKLKTKTRTWRDVALGGQDEEPIEVTETVIEFELYDAQSALSLLGKHHKLFVDGPTGDANDPIHIKMDQ
jgi:phage terminase small subunit